VLLIPLACRAKKFSVQLRPIPIFRSVVLLLLLIATLTLAIFIVLLFATLTLALYRRAWDIGWRW